MRISDASQNTFNFSLQQHPMGRDKSFIHRTLVTCISFALSMVFLSRAWNITQKSHLHYLRRLVKSNSEGNSFGYFIVSLRFHVCVNGNRRPEHSMQDPMNVRLQAAKSYGSGLESNRWICCSGICNHMGRPNLQSLVESEPFYCRFRCYGAHPSLLSVQTPFEFKC